jgi:hypothetical protein
MAANFEMAPYIKDRYDRLYLHAARSNNPR